MLKPQVTLANPLIATIAAIMCFTMFVGALGIAISGDTTTVKALGTLVGGAAALAIAVFFAIRSGSMLRSYRVMKTLTLGESGLAYTLHGGTYRYRWDDVRKVRYGHSLFAIHPIVVEFAEGERLLFPGNIKNMEDIVALLNERTEVR